jgi:hypothetical protein
MTPALEIQLEGFIMKGKLNSSRTSLIFISERFLNFKKLTVIFLS